MHATNVACTMIDAVVGGRFRIVRLIGKGGMGSVWEARHDTLPRRFAVKLLRPELSTHSEFLERFRREAIAAARIDHPNVIYITDFGQTEAGQLYIVMEYLEGTGLDELLRRQGRLPLDRALRILTQVAEALRAAHAQGVIHRDMKPENILLTERYGQSDVVKLLDFGIARVEVPEFVDRALTSAGRIIGTAEYMAPEQALGQPCDARADIYAFGCLSYEVMTGTPPFVGAPGLVLARHVHDPIPPPSTQLRDQQVPSEIDALVLRCLAKERDGRYQHTSELVDDLKQAATLLFGARAADAVSDLGFSAPPATARSGARRPSPADVEQLRQAHHDLLRELALGSIRSDAAPSGLADQLDELLAVEQEIATLTGSVALAEQDLRRQRYDHGRLETQLRHAIIDLELEREAVRHERLQGGDAVPLLEARLKDLNYQIGKLRARLADPSTEHQAAITGLAEQMDHARETRRAQEHQAAALYQRLATKLEAWRAAQADLDPELSTLFDRLNQTREAWQRALL